jgi:tetratricopeptide (TPR) repeat protein
VEGRGGRAGDRLRQTAQLVDPGGRVLWSGRFDEQAGGLFALQDRIATEVAGALALRVTEHEQNRVRALPPEGLEAYDLVLRARPALQRPTRANNVESRALLRRALEIDPQNAAAHAALAQNHLLEVSLGWTETPAETLRQAEALAHRALSLDRAQVGAHITLGRVHIFWQRYDEARTELDRALATNPSDAQAIAGRGNLLMWLGQTDAAIEALERAQRIDPELNALDRFALSLAYYLKQRYPAAIEQAESNLRDNASAIFSRIVLAASYAQFGRTGDAEQQTALIRRTNPSFDPQTFGTKFVKPSDLEHLRDGFRKAGLLS